MRVAPGFSASAVLNALRTTSGTVPASQMVCAHLVIGGEHGDRVHVLVALLVQATGAALADDAHHRRAVHVGVGDTGDEVGRSRPQGAETHTRFPGQPPVGVGGERGGLLVPAEHEADGAVHQRDHHVRVLFPGNPEDVGDALRLQAAYEQVGCLHGVVPRRSERSPRRILTPVRSERFRRWRRGPAPRCAAGQLARRLRGWRPR